MCKDIDKWTVLTEDIESMKSSTAGVSTTYGLDFKLYWYDESFSHEITYTGKVYKEKLVRQREIKDILDHSRNLPKSKEEWMERMRKNPDYVEIDGKFYTAKFVASHPEKFNPVMAMMAENING